MASGVGVVGVPPPILFRGQNGGSQRGRGPPSSHQEVVVSQAPVAASRPPATTLEFLHTPGVGGGGMRMRAWVREDTIHPSFPLPVFYKDFYVGSTLWGQYLHPKRNESLMLSLDSSGEN